MIYYSVCDQDGFTTNDVDLADTHYTANPTHTSHMGAGGDSSNPIPYTGSSNISEVGTDPVSPTPGQIWVLKSGSINSDPIGLLLSLTRTSTLMYQLSYRTSDNTTLRTTLT